MLWENVAYLVDDGRRAVAFEDLRQRVGLDPRQILSAPADLLADIARVGLVPDQRAAKMHESARLALTEDLGELPTLSIDQARRRLKKFWGIGTPGADKILLVSGAHVTPSVESNGLRVLGRLGAVQELPSYDRMYRAARAFLEAELGLDRDVLIRAYELLRRHGHEQCKRTAPLCVICPLKKGCAWYRHAKVAP